MTYEVELTKWRAIAALAAVCGLSATLFFGGVLVGVGLWQPTREDIRMAREFRQKQPPGVEDAVRKAAAAPAAPAPVAVAERSTPAPAPHETASAAAPAPPPPAAAPAATVPAEEAKAEPAEPAQFVLQVGSFRDAKNAKQLQTELSGRGYQATIFNALDSDQRMWHVVRVGRYQDLASAAADAARIGDKEQLQAMIRRGDRL